MSSPLCAHGIRLATRAADCTTCFIDDCALLTPDRCSCDDRNEGDEIECPSCGEEFDCEARGPFVTYWGEEGWQEAECGCGANLKIRESVSRTFVAVLIEKPKETT